MSRSRSSRTETARCARSSRSSTPPAGRGARPAIFKPHRLAFEAVASDLSFAYFRLETAPLAPVKVKGRNVKFADGMQDLTEMGPGAYDSLSIWENRSPAR